MLNTNSLVTLIETMSEAKGDKVTYEEFNDELMKLHKDVLGIKENEDIFIVYSNNFETNQDPTSIEFNCKSMIFDRQTFTPIVTQYNNVLYNDNALKFIETVDWNNVTAQKCYEGTLIIVFNHNNKWYTSTRRCFDANESVWVKGNSYGQLFAEAINNNFTYDDLNPDYCYHFVLVHHKNKNIVSYSNLENTYSDVYHILTTEKYTMNEVESIVPNVKTIPEEKFNNIGEMLDQLNNFNSNDVTQQTISLEGFVLRCYTGTVHNSPFVTLKLQTKLYETLTRYKPNNSNIYQCFLELYQIDKLTSFIPFFIQQCGQNENCGMIINTIHFAMRNMATELKTLYFMTRKKNNAEIYSALPKSYKNVVFGIHGIFLNNNSIPISGLAVYNYLKFLPSKHLRQLFSDRHTMSMDNKFTFINRNCNYSTTLVAKMFGI